MEFGKNFISFVYLMMTIIVILLVNISPTITTTDFLLNDIDSDDNELFPIDQQKYHQQQKQQVNNQQSIGFNFDNLQKLRWRQKLDNDKLNLPQTSKLVRLPQQTSSIQGFSWQNNQNYAQDDNENFNFEKNNAINGFDEYVLDDLQSSQLYGIQNAKRDLNSKQHAHPRYVGKPKKIFQSLCQAKRELIGLETATHIYRPDHYEEVICLHPNLYDEKTIPGPHEKNKVCSDVGFHCVQLNRTIFLTRREKGSDCWETESRIVQAGCECMWPKHRLGDMKSFDN